MLIVVAGTATEIGKTWATAAVAARLRALGVPVHARKPAQSFDRAEPGPTDADVLGAATGEAAATVCPPHRWYEVALAPPMAAAVLGRPPIALADLVAETHVGGSIAGAVTFVETAGGVRSPQADDGDAIDLVAALRPDLVLLVADAGLGTINAVRLCRAAFASAQVLTLLNRYDPESDLHRANADWLRTRDGLDVVTDVEAVVERVLGALRR